VYGRGVIRFHSGDYARAALDFEQAIRLDPNFALAYSGRASCTPDSASTTRRSEITRRLYASTRTPDFITAAAGATCGRAITIGRCRISTKPSVFRPVKVGFYSGRGYVHIKRHEYDQAIQDYDQALRLRPNVEDYDMRGWVYYRKGDYLSASLDYVRASWRRMGIPGGWIWIPLVLAAWLIYMLLRRRAEGEGGGARRS